MKTAIRYFVEEQLSKDPGFVEKNLTDICASIQHRIVSYLLRKLEAAMEREKIDRIGLAGGVAANSELRKRFEELARQRGGQSFVPDFEYCTDNAAMIAISGHYQFEAGNFQSLNAVPFARYDY